MIILLKKFLDVMPLQLCYQHAREGYPLISLIHTGYMENETYYRRDLRDNYAVRR